MKASYSEIDIVKDILDVVKNLKQTINELEDIAKELQQKVDTGTKTFEESQEEEGHTNKEVISHHHSVKCNLCSKSFMNVSEVEKHIQSTHKEHPTYECNICRKKFVTKWRLEKHIKMHSGVNLKECKYFRNKDHCPFDNLGCKFFHGTLFQDEETSSKMDQTPELLNEPNSDTFNQEDIEANKEEKSFYTSTPLKKQELKCDECLDISQCTDCLIKQHFQERHEDRFTSQSW